MKLEPSVQPTWLATVRSQDKLVIQVIGGAPCGIFC
jgi:hypothetical protein